MPGVTKVTDPTVFTTIPQGSSGGKEGQLSDQKLKQYFDDGFLIVKDLFDHSLLDKAREDIKGLVDELAHKLYDAGKIKSLYEEYGLFQRLSKLDQEFPGANIILHKGGKLPQSFRDLWTNDKLLNIAEQILGTADIVGNPIWNLRCKTPKTEAGVVPWHQDAAYMDDESYNHLVFTAWIPFLDADENNGCMQMARGGHKAGTIATHQCCYGGTWYVMLEEEEMKKSLNCDAKSDAVTCEVPYGGAVLFSNILPHRSLPNNSEDIRWAMDLRFNRMGAPAGLWGLKEGIQLRSSTNPDLEIDWETFMAVDRTEKQFAAMETVNEDFDTTIHGPWMKKWDIVHMNRHTQAGGEENKLPPIIG